MIAKERDGEERGHGLGYVVWASVVASNIESVESKELTRRRRTCQNQEHKSMVLRS